MGKAVFNESGPRAAVSGGVPGATRDIMQLLTKQSTYEYQSAVAPAVTECDPVRRTPGANFLSSTQLRDLAPRSPKSGQVASSATSSKRPAELQPLRRRLYRIFPEAPRPVPPQGEASDLAASSPEPTRCVHSATKSLSSASVILHRIAALFKALRRLPTTMNLPSKRSDRRAAPLLEGEQLRQRRRPGTPRHAQGDLRGPGRSGTSAAGAVILTKSGGTLETETASPSRYPPSIPATRSDRLKSVHPVTGPATGKFRDLCKGLRLRTASYSPFLITSAAAIRFHRVSVRPQVMGLDIRAPLAWGGGIARLHGRAFEAQTPSCNTPLSIT